jgi:ABC-type nitrate/sulfonate/bicarbonate transport system ATPase subunit
MTSSGGGVLDVAAFALRLAAITLTKPHARRIIIMDEPFRFVSEAFRSRIKDMLESLAEEYGFQFIMVTHIKELICGRNIAL